MSANLITERILLPSSGTRIYGDVFDGNLTLRAMTTEEERIRLSGQSFYQTMSDIVNNCIVDNKNPDGTFKVDSRDLTDFDFFAVCVKLRILSYGAKYRTNAVCPKCGHQFTYVADLSKLNINMLPEDFSEPYDVGPLPRSNDTLGCRFLRVRDRIEIEKQKDVILSRNPNYVGDPMYMLEMQRRISTVNGERLDVYTAEQYVSNMIAMDSCYYHDKVDDNVYGVVRLGTAECENPKGCDGVAVWVLKVDREFFRPVFDD